MFSSPTIIERGNNIQVTYGNDRGLYPVFSMQAVRDDAVSEKEGREVYRDVEWVDIHILGDTLTKPSRPVTAEDKIRFRDAYEAFKNQSIVAQNGTPIIEWPPVSKSMAMMLKSLNIHTVEQLAEVADGNLTWMGARDLQKKAIAWLAKAKDGAGVSAVVEENKALRTEMEALKNQMAALMNQADKPVDKRTKEYKESNNGKDAT